MTNREKVFLGMLDGAVIIKPFKNLHLIRVAVDQKTLLEFMVKNKTIVVDRDFFEAVGDSGSGDNVTRAHFRNFCGKHMGWKVNSVHYG